MGTLPAEPMISGRAEGEELGWARLVLQQRSRIISQMAKEAGKPLGQRPSSGLRRGLLSESGSGRWVEAESRAF